MFRIFAVAVLALIAAQPAIAADLTVTDAYARSGNPNTGAAFMTVMNAGETPDRLVEARSDVARKTELHTHVISDGIARMRPVDAIEIPAGGEARLERGGDHDMFIGLHEPLPPGATFPVELVFESGRSLTVELTVEGPGGGMGHGGAATE
ncbi:MAG TPA: copper chaperone PCu(A)C [Paracoccaceae bacterium]|nr:copper chaperone PCu(A)C [Paracoccaceae bacterium]